LKGLKIRVQNSKTAMQMVAAMGGAPTPIAYGELYTSLEQGVVDGAENNPPSLLTSRHYEICKYYALDEHSAVPDVVLIGETTWSGLTQTQQAMIQKAANDSATYQRELWAKENQSALEDLAAAGVEISHPDKTPFQDSVKALHDSYEGTAVGSLLNRIQQSRATESN
jgi:TRAP-type C4-dicarboxylate transport system substrate-binding protein